jgi:CubicO group peptidase (beta-lactamase class C family)
LTRRGFAVAALAFFLVGSWLHEMRAESQASVPGSFSRAGLERISAYLHNEIVTGKIPGAVLLIQQHGKPVYFESFGVRSVTTKLRMTPDTIFRIY